MTNAEAVDLCQVLGVPVKSHSSSLNEAYSDMVRRRAIRDGLTRPEQPPEPEPQPKAKKAASKTTKKAAVDPAASLFGLLLAHAIDDAAIAADADVAPGMDEVGEVAIGHHVSIEIDPQLVS